MRNVARLIILLGALLLALAAYDAWRGTASAMAPGATAPMTATKAGHPQDFERIMAYQWIRGSMVLYAGFFVLRRCRRSDATDPFSPAFGRNIEADELRRSSRKID